jgi:pimeloyl-ACP methyl ester carboxylesterase
VPALSDDFRSPIRTHVPTLFISGTLDSQTPPAQADEVRKGFARSVHVVVENAGHESTLPHAEVQALLAAFFRGEQLRDQTVALPPLRFVNPR